MKPVRTAGATIVVVAAIGAIAGATYWYLKKRQTEATLLESETNSPATQPKVTIPVTKSTALVKTPSTPKTVAKTATTASKSTTSRKTTPAKKTTSSKSSTKKASVSAKKSA